MIKNAEKNYFIISSVPAVLLLHPFSAYVDLSADLHPRLLFLLDCPQGPLGIAVVGPRHPLRRRHHSPLPRNLLHLHLVSLAP